MNIFLSAKKNLIGFQTENGYSFRSQYSQMNTPFTPYWASLFAALEFLNQNPQIAKDSYINIFAPDKKFIRMKSEVPKGLEETFAIYKRKFSFSLNYSSVDIFKI